MAMNISYYHKNVHSLTEASRTYIEERISTLEEVCLLDTVRVEVDHVKNGQFHVSIQANSGSHVYYASANDVDLHSAAETVRGELRSQMQKDKKRLRDLMRRGARSLKKKITISNDARL